MHLHSMREIRRFMSSRDVLSKFHRQLFVIVYLARKVCAGVLPIVL